MAGIGIDRNVSHARFNLRRYTVFVQFVRVDSLDRAIAVVALAKNFPVVRRPECRLNMSALAFVLARIINTRINFHKNARLPNAVDVLEHVCYSVRT
jgi:hypothetical protein